MGGIRALKRAVWPRRGPAPPHRGWMTAMVIVVLTLFDTACGGGQTPGTEGRRDPALEARVEEYLPIIEAITGLESRSPPVVRVADAGVLEGYLLERLEEEYPGNEIEHVARAYREFGLLGPDVELRRLLVDLLLEQALGYYDPERDVLFIREEVPETGIEQVMVHELVHALQDQHLDLDSLLSVRDGNDERTAAQAAMEGHATLAMLAYQVRSMTGRTVPLEALPRIGPEAAAAAADAAQMEKLFAAPAIIRESLLFPYFGGSAFLQRLWGRQGESFAPLGDWLPRSTEQVLHVERILGEPDEPTRLRIQSAPDGWREVYASDLGEFELRIYFEEHLKDPPRAQAAAAGWDGDAYSLIEREGRHALVWYTVWDNRTEAEEFVSAYEAAFRARFGGAPGADLVSPERRAIVERMELGGLPAIGILEGPADSLPGRVPAARVLP